MAIKLRVVGILYNNVVNIPGGSTVKQVLDEAVKNPGTAAVFGYTPAPATVGGNGTLSVSAFLATYLQPIKSVTSHTVYDAGPYYLEESASGPRQQSIWQYYIFDANGRVVGPNSNYPVDPTNPGGGTIYYFDDVGATVPEGGSLVWRLVTIPTKTNAPSPFALKRMIHTPVKQKTSQAV